MLKGEKSQKKSKIWKIYENNHIFNTNKYVASYDKYIEGNKDKVIYGSSTNLVQKIGENIIIRKIEVISGEITEFYIHSNRKIASGVSLISGSEAVAKEISMHIAATNPIVLSPEDLDKEFIEKEREIFRSQVENTDKPKEILEKMVEGKLSKQLADISLLKQPFVKDPSKKIETFLSESSSEIKSFIRLEVGEGIEIEKKDFAEEVQSQLES